MWIIICWVCCRCKNMWITIRGNAPPLSSLTWVLQNIWLDLHPVITWMASGVTQVSESPPTAPWPPGLPVRHLQSWAFSSQFSVFCPLVQSSCPCSFDCRLMFSLHACTHTDRHTLKWYEKSVLGYWFERAPDISVTVGHYRFIENI